MNAHAHLRLCEQNPRILAAGETPGREAPLVFGPSLPGVSGRALDFFLSSSRS